jgi:hypothetical protein
LIEQTKTALLLMETHRHIKDRLIKQAATIWGRQGAQTESSFDPIVAILFGACATELEKIGHEIEDTRGRTLERLVQLLYPEVLAQAMPAHAIATANPTEPSVQLSTEAQFYFPQRNSLPGDAGNVQWKNIYFSPACAVNLFKSRVKLMATTRQIHEIDAYDTKDLLLQNKQGLQQPSNTLWLGIEHPEHLTKDACFYFDYRTTAGQTIFYNYLQEVQWLAEEQTLPTDAFFGRHTPLETRPDAEEIINGKTNLVNKIVKHINTFYASKFVTLRAMETPLKAKAWPDEIKAIYGADLNKIKNNASVGWLKLEMPENMHAQLMDDGLVVALNCFPVLNRKLVVHQHRLMEHLNIIPLAAGDDGYFVDVVSIADSEGQELLGLGKSTAESPISLHFGGVERFDERSAVKSIESLIQHLRNESVAFSNIGFDFFNDEIKALHQGLNKLEQQLEDRQLMKGDTPYLMIADKAKIGTSNVFIKYWTTDGAAGNNVRSSATLRPYNNMDVESDSIRLLTATQGGRNKLSDSDKVLAYKTALLNKEKLVTHEDVTVFCRLRLAIQAAQVSIRKGYTVAANTVQGFTKTMEVRVELTEMDYRALQERGTIEFWQQDLAAAIEAISNFFMPIHVTIHQQKMPA